MARKNTIAVDATDLYRFLITDLRYGYSRNNHLMPSCAYDEVKKYLMLMKKKDPELAEHTATQLCEECISDQLSINFYDGLDDQHGNRKEALEFVDYCIDFTGKKPYNYSNYLDNIEKANNIKYKLCYWLDAKDFTADYLKTLPSSNIATDLTLEEADKEMVKALGSPESATWNTLEFLDGKTVVGHAYRIIEPSDYAGIIYGIIKEDK